MNISLCFLILACVFPSVNAAASCSCNCNGGGDDNCSHSNPLYQRSIKQCVYKNMNEDKDVGLLTTCSFTKAKSSTSLRVTYQGDMRVVGCSPACCRRWFITINDKECTSPATIDTQIHATGTANRHSPKTLDGFCDNIPKGLVTVGLSIAACHGYAKGDGYTGWQSVSRFIIEEVPPLQQ